MKTGYIISITAHALLLVLVLFGSFWANRAPREAVIAPVEVIDSNAFDTLVAASEALRGDAVDPNEPLPDQDAIEEVIGEDTAIEPAADAQVSEDVTNSEAVTVPPANEDVVPEDVVPEDVVIEENTQDASAAPQDEIPSAPPVNPADLPDAELPAPRASLAFIRPPTRRPANLAPPAGVEIAANDEAPVAEIDEAQDEPAANSESNSEAETPSTQAEAPTNDVADREEAAGDETLLESAIEALDAVPLPPSRDPARLTEIAANIRSLETSNRQAEQSTEPLAAAEDATQSETDAIEDAIENVTNAPDTNETADEGANDADTALDALPATPQPPRRPADLEPVAIVPAPQVTTTEPTGDSAAEAAAIEAAVENVTNDAATSESTTDALAPSDAPNPAANLPAAPQPPRRPNLQNAAERVRVEAAARQAARDAAATQNAAPASNGVSETDAINALLSQVAGEGERRALSGNELAAIGARIGQFWNQTLLREKPNYENLIVRISVPVLKSGAIGGNITPIEPSNPTGDFLFAYEEARRAVLAAAPLPLPQDIFNDGDILILRFDPKNGIGM